MTKNEFVELVQSCGELNSKKEAERAVKAFTEAVTQALSKKEDVSIVGFGAFKTAFQKGKEGKVPGTDKTYKTEDKYVPKFKPGKELKDKVENS